MNIKKNIGLLLLPALVFSQNAKIEKFKKSYNVETVKNGYSILRDKDDFNKVKIADQNGEIVSSYTGNELYLGTLNCNKYFTGIAVHGGNDGGGWTHVDYKEVKVRDITDSKSVQSLDYYFYSFYDTDEFGLHRIFYDKNQIGLVNSCGKIVVAPKYKYIKKFNEQGQAIVFTENEYTVIDTLGNAVLQKPFKYVRNDFNGSTFAFDQNFKVNDNRIVATYDTKNYGLLDIKTNKEILPFKYDFIEEKKKELGIDLEKFYVVYKDKKIGILDYKTLKEVLPVSENATYVMYAGAKNDKYLVLYSGEINGKRFENAYYGKTLFDPKLDIKAVKIYNDRFITLHLGNGDSMIYDVDKSKFISTIKGQLVKVGIYSQSFGLPDNKKQNRYDKSENFFLVTTCENSDCYNEPSIRSALFSTDGIAKTSFLKDPSFAIIQIDKQQEKLLFLVNHRIGSSLGCSLFDNNGKPVLENFKIFDTDKEYNFIVDNNLLVLNEESDPFVYGKTTFDIDGKMIGERYMYISNPSRKAAVKTETKEQTESQKNNRFLKK
ncbi:WG repeat-containing protein [Flavobacterium chungangense]|uniref:WG repeat-containing protein n=1 Tax=Flavobacterium chungangense TaxID=554283 RepID=A0A6V6ZDZ9_9FLAO|nr:WG repeat-containing protein [Flavobacterium chungangense]CAD0009102.1 hypothetical protein FLACHUCJ7_04086 [Flavobacterium chungangense]